MEISISEPYILAYMKKKKKKKRTRMQNIYNFHSQIFSNRRGQHFLTYFLALQYASTLGVLHIRKYRHFSAILSHPTYHLSGSSILSTSSHCLLIGYLRILTRIFSPVTASHNFALYLALLYLYIRPLFPYLSC